MLLFSLCFPQIHTVKNVEDKSKELKIVRTVFSAVCIEHHEHTHIQGGPKNAHFLGYHIFAATKDIVMRFSLKCSEITAENNK